MINLIKTTLAFAFGMFLSISAALAQETTTPEAGVSGEASEDGAIELVIGEDVADEDAVGQPYVKETHGDWELRCVRTEAGNDPCQLYQLLMDDKGNSVAEISMFALPDGQQAVAGATIAVPLETLLPQQLTITIDGGQGRRYPFTWCAIGGCFARVGLTAVDLAAYKRGATGIMTIVPVASPDTQVNLSISLSGFTAGFAAVSATRQQ
jgi:invasion protein IalB